jgi:hypothetical protein
MQQPAEHTAKISGRRADRISHVMFFGDRHRAAYPFARATGTRHHGRHKWPRQPVPSSSFPRAHRQSWSLVLPSHVTRTFSAPIHRRKIRAAFRAQQPPAHLSKWGARLDTQLQRRACPCNTPTPAPCYRPSAPNELQCGKPFTEVRVLKRSNANHLRNAFSSEPKRRSNGQRWYSPGGAPAPGSVQP